MKASHRKSQFASRPDAEELWVHSSAQVGPPAVTGETLVRLTIDVTPALRSRIKVAAIARQTTLKDMLRELLAREFPPIDGERS